MYSSSKFHALAAMRDDGLPTGPVEDVLPKNVVRFSVRERGAQSARE